MLEFEIQRSQRRCCVTDREFQPGERFYSALVETPDAIERQDYGEDAWKGPPDDTVAWWKTQVPSLATLRMKWAPSDVMLHYFERVLEDPSKSDTAYVLGLLMLRKRILRQREADRDSAGREHLRFSCARNGREYDVPVVEVSASRVEALEAELAELLDGPATQSGG